MTVQILRFIYFLFYVYEILPGYMSVYYVCKVEVRTEGIGFRGTAVRDSCELPYRCWKWNLGPLQGLLTIEPSPQPPKSGFIFFFSVVLAVLELAL